MVGEFYSDQPSTDGRCCSCCPGWSGPCIASCCACKPPGKRNILEEHVLEIIKNNVAAVPVVEEKSMLVQQYFKLASISLK